MSIIENDSGKCIKYLTGSWSGCPLRSVESATCISSGDGVSSLPEKAAPVGETDRELETRGQRNQTRHLKLCAD